MSTNESVTEEELRALMPFYEVEESRFRHIKKRIVIRTSIVGLLMTLRALWPIRFLSCSARLTRRVIY